MLVPASSCGMIQRIPARREVLGRNDEPVRVVVHGPHRLAGWRLAVAGRLGNARPSQFREPGPQRGAARLPRESEQHALTRAAATLWSRVRTTVLTRDEWRSVIVPQHPSGVIQEKAP
jgi:hypothetical protein